MPKEAVTQPPLSLLPLDLVGLSGPQRRGAICVWGGESLGVDAVNLGDHRLDGTKVFPRACPRCVADQAAETAGAHAAICESCVDNPMGCETVRALRRLYMEHAR
ncbi:hypothetical protein [Streptomyces stelliscabiei]|uniref:hypothetical protein n=1 Tax=Streptomyces stelliscabiei TaxID=146820 RepID=UPI0029B65312|nr:hypothetical protein [Streptomyces stelliscabiei]MDX2550084.1 hypothetical protein [Streptomyces stelliscabiei]